MRILLFISPRSSEKKCLSKIILDMLRPWRHLLVSGLIFVHLDGFSLLASVKTKEELNRWSEAQSFFYQKRYPQAIALIENLLKKHPEDIKLQLYYSKALAQHLEFKSWFRRAQWLLSVNRFNHAMKALKQAEMIYPFHSSLASLKSDIIDEQESHEPLDGLNPQQTSFYERNYKKAKKRLNVGDNREALKLFAQALSIAPKASNALEGYSEAQKRFLAGQSQNKIKRMLKEARLFRARRQWVNALAKYKAIVQLDPANEESIEQIPDLEWKIENEKLLAQKVALSEQYKLTGKRFVYEKKFVKAIEQYQLGKEVLPKYTRWDSLIKEAERLQRIEDEKLRKELNKRIERNYNRGLVFIASEKYKDAVASFQQVVTDATKLQRFVMADQARDIIEKVTVAMARKEEEEVNIDSPYYDLVESIKALGLKALENKNYIKAKKNFEQILDLFPYNRLANQYLAFCKIKINPTNKDKILETFLEEIRFAIKTRQEIKAKRVLNIVLFIDKNYEPAKELAKKLREVGNIFKTKDSSPKIKALWKEALRAQNQNNVQKAIGIAKDILKLNPANANARGLLNRLERGAIVRSSTVNIPSTAKRAYTQGILFYNTGSLGAAIQSFEKAIKIFPNYTKAAIALRKCKKYLGTR